VNAPGDPVYSFVNEDGSGWMTDWNWNSWKTWMSGDHEDRERGRRHKPSYNAYAAALITQASIADADAVANRVYSEARRDWYRKENFWGRLHYQWRKHLVVQHLGGTVALFFIPVIGPFLSTIASGMTPMIEAAARNAVAQREGGRVSRQFREDYYKAMDSWLNGESEELPVEFLEYHASVVLPAAREVRDGIKAKQITTAEGVFPLNSTGLDVWRARNEPYQLENVQGFFGAVSALRAGMVYEIHEHPARVAVGLFAGVLSGAALYLALRRTA